MRRPRFITLIGGAAAWPLAAHAQQGGGMRRIGVLMSTAAADVEGQARTGAFLQGWLRQHPLTVDGMARISDAWRCGDAICNFCARWLCPGRKLCLCPAK